ncbi:uncharacterized protein LOC105696740 [Orussus abietinus]|uniref:uncharacterized protein LOC105696740 n=1 Tax=Orussus abietinus TaxID=222816 RepID=UPI00062503E6|nr:uncharacterized protein LOC105696740 [Orussus abietinus]
MSTRNGQFVADINSGKDLSPDEVSTVEGVRAKSTLSRGADPASLYGRRIQLPQMLVLIFIPILVLSIQTCGTFCDILAYKQEMTDLETQITRAAQLDMLITRIQLERLEVALLIYINGNSFRSNLTQRFRATNKVLENLPTWSMITVTDYKEENQILKAPDKIVLEARLDNCREKLETTRINMPDVTECYNGIIADMLNYLTKQIKETDNTGVWRYLVALKKLLWSLEYLGIASVDGINYFANGVLARDLHVHYVRYDTLSRDLLTLSLTVVPSLKPLYVELTRTMLNYGRLKMRRDEILRNKNRQPSVDDTVAYFETLATYTDELRKLQLELHHNVRTYVNAILKEVSSKEGTNIAIVVLLLIVAPVTVILVRNAVETIKMHAANLAQKSRELKREKKKSDTLLFQMLPQSVAQQLKQIQQAPAEYYEAATVYFSDIIGFGSITAEVSPFEAVTLLNSIYKLFDSRIDCYDVYKVETVGCSYMVASGAPIRNGDKHASEIATLALDLLSASSFFQIPKRPGVHIQLRSGVHTGPVVAGIVGTKIPRYCLLGDTVSTASFMETTGEALRIHISQDTKKILDSVGGFNTERRGLVDVMGKGFLETHWLISKEGGIIGMNDLDMPTSFEDVRPVFMRRLREEGTL